MAFRSGTFLNRGILYDQTDDMELLTDLKESAQQFKSDMFKFGARQGMFKQLLQYNLREGSEVVGNEDIATLWQQLPFLFSPTILPAQMKILVFGAKQGSIYDVADARALETIDTVSLDMDIYQAIKQSLKYGKPYLMSAFDQYKKIRGYFNGTTQEDRQRDQRIIEQQKLSPIRRIVNYIVSPIAYLLSAVRKIDRDLFSSNDASIFFQQTLTKAKVYGDVVINCAYLQKYGLKQMVNGALLITDPMVPSLRFQIVSGKVIVYLYQQGNLELIQQSQFTLDFLRSILKGIYLKRSGGVMKTFNSYMDPDAQNQPRKMQFQQYFYAPRNARGRKPYNV